MKANELMIGDWVKFPNSIDKVCDLPFIAGMEFCASFAASAALFPIPVDKINPIPLTMEILEMNGIIKEMDSSLVFPEDVNRYLVLISNCGKLFWQYNLVAINYVHELQHALRLCEIEKEIELCNN